MTSLKRAFTLVEVNLAIFIMAGGVLAMVSLYSLGFRESQQSRDDVAAAGYADAFFAPIVSGLSATNVLWSQWRTLGGTAKTQAKDQCDAVIPKNGWLDYVEATSDSRSQEFKVKPGCQGTADKAFDEVMAAAKSPFKGSKPAGMPDYYAFVATRRGATISLGFRSSRRRDQLMSQPIYYTEIHFQGDPNR